MTDSKDIIDITFTRIKSNRIDRIDKIIHNSVMMDETITASIKEVEDTEEVKEIKEEEPSFDDMKCLSNNFELLRGIMEYGFRNPSRIQKLVIDDIYDKYDIIAQSQSGTGKTGAFSIGALASINKAQLYPQVLILANTRELATQIHYVISNLSKYMNLNICLCVGGTDVTNTNKHERIYGHVSTAHILIGTPGRIIDYITRKAFNILKIKLFIMDEADTLLKNDFVEQIQSIYTSLSRKAQVCVFSATYDEETLELTKTITNENRKTILMERDKLSIDLIQQYKIDVQREYNKFDTLADLYKKLQIGQCIIFVNTINNVERLSRRMIDNGFVVSKIHAQLSSFDRNKILHEFRIGLTRVLISTDILSRGIDIEQIGIVINYDMPRTSSQYLHRIGRSGRFGKKGVAINFITDDEQFIIQSLNEEFNVSIEDMPEPSYVNEYLTGQGGHLKLNK